MALATRECSLPRGQKTESRVACLTGLRRQPVLVYRSVKGEGWPGTAFSYDLRSYFRLLGSLLGHTMVSGFPIWVLAATMKELQCKS